MLRTEPTAATAVWFSVLLLVPLPVAVAVTVGMMVAVTVETMVAVVWLIGIPRPFRRWNVCPPQQAVVFVSSAPQSMQQKLLFPQYRMSCPFAAVDGQNVWQLKSSKFLSVQPSAKTKACRESDVGEMGPG